MAYDGLVTRAVVAELNETIIGGKIDKIAQPHKDEVVFYIRNLGKTHRLIISTNATFGRVCLTNLTDENPLKPFNFCMVLRKHLVGGKLLTIEQFSNDRIIKFTFENSNELKDKEIKSLIVEIMGKYSNIILLTKNSTIIDSIKHIDFSISSIREVMPGRPYILPLDQGKLNPFSVTPKDFLTLHKHSGIPLAKFIPQTFIGIARVLANEVEISNLDFPKIIKTPTPCVMLNNNIPKEVYVYPLLHKENTIKNFDSISSALDFYYTNILTLHKLNAEKNKLLSIISHYLTKAEKKLAIVNSKIAGTNELETLKIQGELLSANLYMVKPGLDKITVLNYYTNENLDILLNKDLSPSKNLQNLFKKYTKLKNTLVACLPQREELLNQISYLESLFFEIDETSSFDNLTDIKNELYKEGLVKNPEKPSNKNLSPSKPLNFSYDNFEIYVGKNNIQNDYLTFSVAKKTDLWFHVRNAPGSHVILKTNNLDVSQDVLEFAASLAAKHSKLKTSPKVDVDFTLVKYVKKIPGAKPGMVIYNNFKTLYVTIAP